MRYRRANIHGGSYFITVVTHNRHYILADETQVALLRQGFKETMQRHPFKVEAIAILPDHFHCILTLPSDDVDYPLRIRLIKSYFTHRFKGQEGIVSDSRKDKHERAVWQRRYWEHAIRDEADMTKHVEYIHYNPVKHGLVGAPRDWPWSSFKNYVEKGLYDSRWGADVGLNFEPGLGAE